MSVVAAAQKRARKESVDELVEIRKVFDLADKDGSGAISADELHGVVSSLVKRALTREELAGLMKQMDANGDGVIEWAEFSAAVGAWLSSSREDTVGDSPSTSKRIHRDINRFFTHFSKATDFEALRARLQADMEADEAFDRSADNNLAQLAADKVCESPRAHSSRSSTSWALSQHTRARGACRVRLLRYRTRQL